jgi:hypothetical protein
MVLTKPFHVNVFLSVVFSCQGSLGGLHAFAMLSSNDLVLLYAFVILSIVYLDSYRLRTPEQP